MNNPKLTPTQVKEKYGYAINQMLHNVLEAGKWVDSVESRLVREGQLKILKNGKYKWLKKPEALTP